MNDFLKIKLFLQNMSFITEDDFELFEPHLCTKKIKAKDFFLENNKICREIGFINTGTFRVFYLLDGKEINTRFCFENEFVVDYGSFLEQKPSKYSIQALSDTEIITLDLKNLQNTYNKSHNWERFGRVMAESSYQTTIQRVDDFLFLDGKQRYEQLLEKESHILEKVPLYHIASYLGLERESLSRLRKKLAKEK